ncbi:hypothetical protein JXA12_04625 [Candidatus Woesearchaeota archaeon]|nr:hypothetical protein [Candidatus Woesearchaeota archaeon]
MDCEEPESMDEIIYYTKRTLEPRGRVTAWTKKKQCPRCERALMGKPVEKGKVKIRATTYECPACGYTEEKKEHEESLTLCAAYTCPSCGKEGASSTRYKRKTHQGVPSYVVTCEHCGHTIALTKKMKEPKKK